ncbi:MAG TPA: thioredoxin domain-containing protein, partial [Polyangiaceae bacterium]|nr:thioredoxin domain-containing protein [Polyangiaceae bacterium]
MNKGIAAVGFLLSFLAGAGLVWGVARSSMRPPGVEPAALALAASPIPISADDPSWGKPDAPVTIVEVSDFQCPFCSRATPTLARIQTDYGADKVRIIWKNNPLPSHANARPAAEAGATVQALGGDFWKFNQLAFAHQKELTRENFQSWAVAAGIAAPKFAQAYDSKQYAGKVDQDLALARQLGANSTPHFFINGKSLVGA